MNPEVLLVESGQVEVEQEEITSTVIVHYERAEVIEVARQGPPGVPGPQGPAGPPGPGEGEESWEDPQMDSLLEANLVPGGTASLDAATITAGKNGQLAGIDCGGSVPLRIDIEVVNGSRQLVTTIYSKAGDTEEWRPPSKRFVEVLGTGDESFGVTVTNLSPHLTADARATVYWDEVTP